jgi:hypothetical protein
MKVTEIWFKIGDVTLSPSNLEGENFVWPKNGKEGFYITDKEFENFIGEKYQEFLTQQLKKEQENENK